MRTIHLANQGNNAHLLACSLDILYRTYIKTAYCATAASKCPAY